MSDQLIAMIRDAMTAKGWNNYQLEHAIGLLPNGRAFSSKQIDRLLRGDRQIRRDDMPLIQRLIDVFDLDDLAVTIQLDFDAADFWRAAGLWPEDLPVEVYRSFVAAGHPGAAATSKAISNPNRPNNLYLLRHTGDQLLKRPA